MRRNPISLPSRRAVTEMVLASAAASCSGVRSERWRYIRYADGSEELYDMEADPNEWQNLASDPALASVIEEHRRWLPKTNAKPAPGSRSRILIYENGQANWEEEDIAADDPIPEM